MSILTIIINILRGHLKAPELNFQSMDFFPIDIDYFNITFQMKLGIITLDLNLVKGEKKA
jgi:hypothetical protein